MLFSKLIARQFRRPTGLLGLYAANFMKKNNQDYYAQAIELLAIQDNDAVLEIGCGAGDAIRQIAERNSKCRIDAIDFSQLILKKAARNNREWLRKGRMRLMCGDFSTYDFRASRYTKILAINVIYFCDDLNALFARCRQLLDPGGRIVLFMSSPERLKRVPFANDDVFHKYTLEFVKEKLGEAGFSPVGHTVVIKQEMETYYIFADVV
jgi:SAM-dependent methyltransferase